MNCVSCGTPNPDHAQTCLTCGKTLLEDQVTAPDIPIPDLTTEQRADEPISAADDEPTVQEQPMPAEQFVFEEPPAASLTPEASSLPSVAEPFTAGQFLSSADAPIMDSEEGGMPLNVSPDIPEIADAAPPTPPKTKLRRIAQPLPLWAFLVGIVPIVGVLITAWFMGRDWAEGAWYVAIAADAIALLIALATGVRSLAGMAAKSNPHRLRQYVSSSLSILVLLLCSMPGLAFQSSIHTAQGHYLETRQQWQAAINEYQLGGDKKPTSENIARTYNEWGDSLSKAQHYEDAIAKFDTVNNEYGAAKTEVSRAQKGDIAAYLAWGKQALQQKHYDLATQRFDELTSQSYCTAQCQQKVGPLDATAHYNLAEAELSDLKYSNAVFDFRFVQTHYPDSPEAKLEHQDMAKALLGNALEAKVFDCNITIANYQELIAHFSDTLQGAVAKLAMILPQPVTGQFPTPIPGKADGLTPVVGLMKSITPHTSTTDFFAQFDSGRIPRTTVNADGTFTLALVPQGQYLLVWGVVKSDGSENIYNGFDGDNNALDSVTVGPACPTNLGDINWTFYSASDFPS